MYYKKISFYLFCLGILSVRIVLAVDIGTDTTINANSTARHNITDDNVTLTNNADIIFGDASAGTILSDSQTGTTIINNAGATIGITGNNDGAVELKSATNPTVINSGTVFSEDGRALSLQRTTGAVFINNAGGVLTAGRSTIRCVTNCANTTIINSGKIIATSIGASTAILMDTSVGLILINNAGGEIIGITGQVIDLGTSGTFTNSGLIRAVDDDGNLILSDSADVI